MATETIVIDIQLSSAIDNVNRAKKSLEDLKREREALNKAIEEGTIAEEDATKALTAADAAIRVQTKEVQSLNRILDNSLKQRKAEKGSIEANRAELAKLTAEYIKLGKPTQEQTDRIKSLSDTLKQQEAALGDTRRNVGNYQGAIEGVLGKLNLFGVNLGQVKNGLIDTQKGFQAAKGGATGLAGGFNVLKVAIVSTGIGAIVIALTSLIALFAKSEKGIELISKGFTILGAVVDTLVKRVEQFATGIAFILDGDFSKGIDAVTGSFKGLGEEISNNISLANDLADAQERLEDAEIGFIERRAQIRAQIQDLRDIANDETKTYQERQKALQEALVLQEELTQREADVAKQRLAVAQQTFELSAKTDEDRRKFEEAKAQDFEEDRDRTKEKIRLENELRTVTKAASVAAREERKKELQAFQDDIVKLTKELKENVEALIEEPLPDFKPTIDIPQFEQQVEELKTRLQNILQDEDGSLFDALGITPDKIDFALSQAQQLTAGLASIFQVQKENRIQDIEDERQAEIERVEQTISDEQQRAAAITNINEKFNNRKIQQERDFANKQKAIDITTALINGALAVTNALATVKPFLPLGVAAAALAASATAIQVGVISAQKFADGVIGLQGAGTETSDSIPAQLSKGESVMTAKATRKYAPVLAQMEMSVGNKPNYQFGNLKFANGIIGDGGFSARTFAQGVNSNVQISELSREIIQNMPDIIVQVSEINRIQRSQAQTAQVSEL